jgi:hypothetical protein
MNLSGLRYCSRKFLSSVNKRPSLYLVSLEAIIVIEDFEVLLAENVSE